MVNSAETGLFAIAAAIRFCKVRPTQRYRRLAEHPPLRQGLVDFGPLFGTGQPLHVRLAQSRIAVHSGNPKITLVKHIDSVIIDDLERQRR
jgi:hypothetical protein